MIEIKSRKNIKACSGVRFSVSKYLSIASIFLAFCFSIYTHQIAYYAYYRGYMTYMLKIRISIIIEYNYKSPHEESKNIKNETYSLTPVPGIRYLITPQLSFTQLRLYFIYQNDSQYLDGGRIMLVGEFLDLVVVPGLNSALF